MIKFFYILPTGNGYESRCYTRDIRNIESSRLVIAVNVVINSGQLLMMTYILLRKLNTHRIYACSCSVTNSRCLPGIKKKIIRQDCDFIFGT